ncbi:hypothetical protein [Thalassobaculum sp.]|uniref:hypothetical protein n=1 Tax=Thalassobaculum sp. TaxID=2022740 RepID=UPI0032EB9B76
MTAPRKAIMGAVAAALAGVATARDGSFERNRLDKFLPAELPGYVLWDGGHEVEGIDTGGAQRALTLDVDVFVTAATGDALSDAIADEAAAVTAALLSDVTLGGVAWDVREAAMTDPDYSREGHSLVAEFALRFVVIYETASANPDLPA